MSLQCMSVIVEFKRPLLQWAALCLAASTGFTEACKLYQRAWLLRFMAVHALDVALEFDSCTERTRPGTLATCPAHASRMTLSD